MKLTTHIHTHLTLKIFLLWVLLCSFNLLSAKDQSTKEFRTQRSSIHLIHTYGIESQITGWIDDEEDACHSYPEGTSTHEEPTLVYLENEVKKKYFAFKFSSPQIQLRQIPFHQIAFETTRLDRLRPFSGPSLPIEYQYPPFLITSLPPPHLSA